jgi:hypothetical protein
VTWLRAAIGVGAAVAVAAVLVSGGSRMDPPAPEFLEIAGLGGGESTVVVDYLGRVVDRQEPGSAAGAGRWIGRARPLGAGAPRWARRMYLRSLLVLRALTDQHGSGASIAGARDGWAYVWPRDAGAVALAFAAGGYRAEARRVTRFLLRLDLDAAARFHPDGTPVEGREAQGDARGWVAAAARAAELPSPTHQYAWRGRADYQEKDPGDYLGNAIALTPLWADGPKASVYRTESSRRPWRAIDGPKTSGIWTFSARRRGVLVRRAGDPESGVDSVAAWAVRPFPRPTLFPAVRRSLHRLVDERGGRFGVVPSEDWPEDDPWTAPTAWTAWAFAALAGRADASAVPLPCYLRQRNSGARGDRCAALRLMGSLRRAATPLGLLPERVDARTGEPRSTTPLAWSHAFAILALHELWPRGATQTTCDSCRLRCTSMGC